MLRVGLVGAGPWAQLFHGPLLAKSDKIDWVGTWARRPEAAQALADNAGNAGNAVFTDFDALLDAVDALAFCVPPNVQSELATRAAHAGKHLLLEKPLAWDLAAGRELVEVIETAGVISQLVLTNRYRLDVKKFIVEAKATQPLGSSGVWVSNACLPGGYFATPWRLKEGVLLDVGPHIFDLLDAALGPITEVHAIGDSTKMLTLVCIHEGGAQSTVTTSAVVGAEAGTTHFEVFGSAGKATLGGVPGAEDTGDVMAFIADEFVAAIATNTQHELNARRGLYLQELIEKAHSQLR